MRIVRWKAVLPLTLLVVLVAAGWWLLLDFAVKRGIEYVGTEIVGARVDVASAHVALMRGAVTVRGLEVTNPDHPMSNLVEAGEIVAQLRLLPLLEKKVVIDTMAVRGVRFGTARRVSGAIEHKSPATGRVARAIAEWAGRIKIPALNFQGITGVDVSRLKPDSLRTIAQARAVQRDADSLQQVWQRDIAQVDPQPQVDTAKVLIARLKQADVKALGLTGTRDLINSARTTVGHLGDAAGRIKALQDRVKSDASTLGADVSGLAAARRADYAYARGLLNLPSLDTPDLSAPLFGQMALDRIRPILYWLDLAQQYIPPGLDPRRETGPKRVRASGTTVRFPMAHQYPALLLLYAGADAQIGGTGPAAAQYAATLTGLTTAPALYGRPLVFQAARRGATSGPRAGAVSAVLDHVRAPGSDSINARLDGVALPTVPLPVAGAELALGSGAFALSLKRSGDNLDGTLGWSSNDVHWSRAGTDSATASAASAQSAPIGSQAWMHGILWRTISRLNTVQVQVHVTGRVASPSLGIQSNVGQAVAQALRREVGDEVNRQEQRLRAEVDRLAQQQVEQAQARVAEVRTKAETALAAKQAEVEQARAGLDAQIKELTKKLPLRIP
jgi:uncharacterized protein (TIGR03545 family)